MTHFQSSEERGTSVIWGPRPPTSLAVCVTLGQLLCCSVSSFVKLRELITYCLKVVERTKHVDIHRSFLEFGTYVTGVTLGNSTCYTNKQILF